MKYCTISRRHFLQGLGGFTLSLPVLPSLLSPLEAAAQSTVDTKLVYLYLPHGGITTNGPNQRFFPTDSNLGAWQTRQLLPGQTYREADITGTNVSYLFGPEFDPFVSRMNFIRGLDIPQYLAHCNSFGAVVNHDMNPELVKTPTLDQVLAYSNNFYSNPASVERCIAIAPSYGVAASVRVDSDNRYQAVPHVSNAQVLFDQIFDNVQSGPGDTLVVDRVLPDFQSLSNNSRLSREDKTRVQSFMNGLFEVQQKLQNQVDCGEVERPPYAAVWPDPDGPKTRVSAQLLNDVVVAALTCGISRIVTVSIGGNSPHYFDLHQQIHAWLDPNNQDMWSLRVKWYLDNVVADLLTKMSQVTQINGNSLLDNSLAVMFPENKSPHDNYDMPIWTCGGANGTFVTGKYLDYRNFNTPYRRGSELGNPTYVGVLANPFFVALLQGFGLSPSDYEQPRSGVYAHGGYGAIFSNNDWGESADPFGVRADSNEFLISNYYPSQFGIVDEPLPGILL